jgi:hypothetical protein
MDEKKIRMVVARLSAFASELPDGDIEEKYVVMFHSYLSAIQSETTHDFTSCFIPTSELQHHEEWTGHRDRFGNLLTTPSSVRYCDRPMFLMSLKTAINYLNSWVIYPKGLLIHLPKSE